MNIVKELITDYRPDTKYGLGEDGKLYYKYIGKGEYETVGEYTVGEYKWRQFEDAPYGCSFQEMKEIVKAFAHLVAFL
jgi:hypothetical protein